MNDLDNKIKKALEDKIKITKEDKQEIWNNIDRELFLEKKKGEVKNMKSKKKRHISFVAAAAAVVILFVGTQTEAGHALIHQIKEMFASQKQITQEIEGNQEKTNVQLQTPSKSNYIIYVDQERYQFIEGEKSDKIVMKTPVEGDFPEVSMEIQQIVDKTPEVIVEELAAQIKAEYEIFYEPKKIEEPIEGWVIRGLGGHKWDSPIINVYVVSNGNQGSFIITQNYFLEAEEGHVVRFDEMVKEFRIINEPVESR